MYNIITLLKIVKQKNTEKVKDYLFSQKDNFIFLTNWSKNQSITIRKHLYYLTLCHLLNLSIKLIYSN